MNNTLNDDKSNNERECGKGIDEILLYLRAKSKENKNYLLRDHLKETIKSAVDLKVFIDENRNAIDYDKFKNESENQKFFEDLIVASFLHDLGKINFGFQKEVFKDEKENEEYKKIEEFFNNNKYKINITDHEIISLIYSLIFNYDEERMKKIRTSILLHHYNEFYVNKEINIRNVLDNYPDIERYIRYMLNNKNNIICLLKKMLNYIIREIENEKNYTQEQIKQILNALNDLKDKMDFNKVEDFIKCIKEGYGTSKKLPLFVPQNKEGEKTKENYDFFVFLGSLRRCDYSASGSVKIEKSGKIIDIFNNIDTKIKNRIGQQQTNKIWQEEILNDLEQKNKNLVLVAPTGSGKTEFALLWAKKIGKKLVYTLPLRVALNDLYERFSKPYTKQEGYFCIKDLRILHSTSFIEYLKEKKGTSKINIDVDEMQITSKLFSSPLILTTPDQVFLSSLKYYGFDKLISIYPISAVVVDEIQAYKPEMAAVIIKTLNIIKQLGGNVLVITATFPPYFSEFINGDNGFEIKDLKNNNHHKSMVKNYTLKRHKIELLDNYPLFSINKNNDTKEKQVSMYTIDNKSKEKIKEIIRNHRSKNILIIVNNVGKAITLFKELENDGEFNDRIVIKDNNNNIPLLLHSRLIEKEKLTRIDAIKEAMKNNKKIILVSTQIVEASVDVDFDLLITEISPIDSQIQRWGRIYRNRDNGNSNNDYRENDGADIVPNIYIFTKSDEGTNAIYDRNVIEKTIETLSDEKYKNVINYESERELIESVFEKKIEDKSLKQMYIDDIKKNLEWLEYYSAEKRSEAQQVFRKINDIKVVFPDLMKNSKDPVAQELGMIIENKDNRNISWNEIEYKIKEKTRQELSHWELIEKMYEYSCNIPFFSFEKTTNYYNFKTFFVLPSKEVDADYIQKYGVEKISQTDIDRTEIDDNILS
jgi:CRISPR-associated endonuclease/helicase Cas3